MRQPSQLASGFAVHLMIAPWLIWLLAGPEGVSTPPVADRPLVWTQRATGLDGGGGGGDGVRASPAPPRRVVPPVQAFTLPRVPDVIAAMELPGAVARLSAEGAHGTGTDDGPDKGKGLGKEGPGSGPRTGPGTGPGDGAFEDGALGVVSPRVLSERQPEYTLEAARTRTEGAVLLEATVLPDGTVGAVKVLRSMTPSFGLDQKAVEAVRAWRFRPGTYNGAPVAVKVLIELSFNLR